MSGLSKLELLKVLIDQPSCIEDCVTLLYLSDGKRKARMNLKDKRKARMTATMNKLQPMIYGHRKSRAHKTLS